MQIACSLGFLRTFLLRELLLDESMSIALYFKLELSNEKTESCYDVDAQVVTQCHMASNAVCGNACAQYSRTTCLLLGPSHWSCRAHTLSVTAILHSCSTAWLKQQLLETFLRTTNAEKTLEGFIYLEQTAVLKKPQTGYQQKQTKGYDW